MRHKKKAAKRLIKSPKTVSVFPNAKEKRQAKKCVLNPETRRMIYVNGTTFKRLLRKYRYDRKRNIFILPTEKSVFNGEYWEFNKTSLSEEAKRLILEQRTIYGENKESQYLKMYFFNNIDSLEKIHECLEEIYKNESKSIKLNIAFGYVTQKEEDIKLIKPGRNYFFNEPYVMKNGEDLKRLKTRLTEESIMNNVTNQFPDSQTQLLGVYAMAVKITRLDFPIGARISLPNYMKTSIYINGLEDVDNNMCFWACMTLAKGCRKDRYIKKANELFTEFYKCRKTRTPAVYCGFDNINELDRYEEFDTEYDINIVSLYGVETITYIRKSPFNESRTPIYLNLYLNHFSYITNFQKLAKVYLCKRCDINNYDIQVHFDICSIKQKMCLISLQ